MSANTPSAAPTLSPVLRLAPLSLFSLSTRGISVDLDAAEDEVKVLVSPPISKKDDWEVTVIVVIVDVLLACDCDDCGRDDATAGDVTITGRAYSRMPDSSTNSVGRASVITVGEEVVDAVEHSYSSGVKTTPKSIHMSCIAGRTLFASARMSIAPICNKS